jgi:hypothetical protein
MVLDGIMAKQDAASGNDIVQETAEISGGSGFNRDGVRKLADGT